jgi:hypothetical protein
MPLLTYTPEMGETKPEETQIEAQLSHYGKHFFISTPLELKGRGIVFQQKIDKKNLYPSAHYKHGWNEYKVTLNAMEKLKKDHIISQKSYLD